MKKNNWIYINFFWLLILVGVVLLYISSIVTNTWWINILEKAGLAILSSGVFASVLKSFQFAGLFKEEIEKIVLGTEFIENRNDLPQLWRQVSKSVYNQKFPEISDELQDIILNNYFPIKHKFYYEDFRYTLNIGELSDDHIIKFTQCTHYYVVLAKGDEETVLEGSWTYDKSEGLRLKRKIEYFKIDGEDYISSDQLEQHEEEGDFEKTVHWKATIKNKKRFLVEIKEYREYHMHDDNYKLVRVNAITKEMDVSIQYPENMKVSFINIGLVEKFERKHIDHGRTISRVHKNGLILPYQGFGIVFDV